MIYRLHYSRISKSFYLLHKFISAMVLIKGFLSRGYLPTIRINSEVLAAVMMLLSNLPNSRNIKNLKYFTIKLTIHVWTGHGLND